MTERERQDRSDLQAQDLSLRLLTVICFLEGSMLPITQIRFPRQALLLSIPFKPENPLLMTNALICRAQNR